MLFINRLGPGLTVDAIHTSSTARDFSHRLAGRRSPLQTSRLLRAKQNSDDETFESLFAKELERRGIASKSPSSDIDFSSKAPQDPFSGTSASQQQPSASATKTSTKAESGDERVETDQRAKSISLVNEGLEGLFPRASLLVRLGSSFFLGFLPLILALSLVFGSIYGLMGEGFVHGGDTRSGPPAYVDPEQLLSEPTVDPYIPYQ